VGGLGWWWFQAFIFLLFFSVMVMRADLKKKSTRDDILNSHIYYIYIYI